jgi:hypothetical protein
MNFREGSGDDFAPASANKNGRNKKKPTERKTQGGLIVRVTMFPPIRRRY